MPREKHTELPRESDSEWMQFSVSKACPRRHIEHTGLWDCVSVIPVVDNQENAVIVRQCHIRSPNRDTFNESFLKKARQAASPAGPTNKRSHMLNLQFELTVSFIFIVWMYNCVFNSASFCFN